MRRLSRLSRFRLGAAAALLCALALGSSQAVTVKLRPQGEELTRAVQAALGSISTKDFPITLDMQTGTTLTVGGVGASSAPFNPDVIARVVLVGGERRIEFNPQGPLPLTEAVKKELAQELRLTDWTPEAAAIGLGGADLNKDGKVDLTDLALLMANFGQVVKSGSSSIIVGDLNGDGRVNDADVRLFGVQYKP